MGHYLNIFIRAIFIDNLALALFLGLCPFVAVSKRVSTAFGLGTAISFVLLITVPLNYLVYSYLLRRAALSWLSPNLAQFDLSFLQLVTFLGTIAAIVQIVEMFLDRYIPALYSALGVFLPLIAANCAIIGGSLFMVRRNYSLPESTAFALGSGIGWTMAISALAAIRERLQYSVVPAPLRGIGITFILIGVMAMGFQAFSGIRL